MLLTNFNVANAIQGKYHSIGLMVSLSSYNDKKFILKDGYGKLSHFR